MSTAVLPGSAQPQASVPSSFTVFVGILLALWLALVFLLGSAGAFITPPGTPPLAIFTAVTAPIATFLIAYRASQSFRDYVLGFDVRLATGIQAWRFAGLGFIALQTFKILPGVFTWPAGLGDIAIGATAPFVAIAISLKPEIAASRGFVIWNLLGLLDLVVAVTIGTLVASQVISVTDGTTTGPMASLPLLLIPAFLVPMFVMLHLTALIQARHFAIPANGAARARH
ncbi:MAG TPA: hypothetical protein VEZ88_07900 [Steroidobacteraceae bacterium]|nr:hypothetical protein [Steroidobacteraceae bacterium]